MESFIRKSRNNFIEELESGDHLWRICRLTSLVDMILVDLVKFRFNPTSTNSVHLFNLCVKSLIVNRVGEITLEKYDTKTIFQEIEDQQACLIETYDFIILELEQNRPPEIYNLYNEEIYLKTISSLDIDSFPESEVRSIAFSITQNKY